MCVHYIRRGKPAHHIPHALLCLQERLVLGSLLAFLTLRFLQSRSTLLLQLAEPLLVF